MPDWRMIIACLIGFIFGMIAHAIVNRVKTIGVIVRDISDPESPKFRFEFDMEPDECINGSTVRFKANSVQIPILLQLLLNLVLSSAL